MWKLKLNVNLMNVDELDEKEGEEEFAERDKKDVRHRKAAYAPTLKERLEHARTHIPFRSWCKVCVAGRYSWCRPVCRYVTLFPGLGASRTIPCAPAGAKFKWCEALFF